jgi:hypothetical protein
MGVRFSHMKLPLRTQTILLERGEAFALYYVIASWWKQASDSLNCEARLRATPEQVLAMPVLQRVGKRLHRIDQREAVTVGKPRKKPTSFKLSYDEVAALMLHLVPHAAGLNRVPLGKVQQVSLNLEDIIRF